MVDTKLPTTGEVQFLEMRPGTATISNGEYLLRMSFLYQAAELLSQSQDASSALLQRHYSMEARNISKRQVLRIDP